MTSSRLRIYRGPNDHVTGTNTATDTATEPAAKACVNVPLSEILPALADAAATDRAWLDDFAGDEVTISADLYEVLMSYRFYRPVA